MFPFFNPLYVLVAPALIIFSVPLTVFAVFTTSIAFITLLIRVLIVYFELALALLRSALFAEPSKPTAKFHAQQASTHHHRRRRSSVLSTSSSQDFAPHIKHAPTKSESFASLVSAGAQGTARDFEGIGGWRNAASDPLEEALWIGMNSRLELPAAVPERQRRHQRSFTGGSQRWSVGGWSPDSMRRSPVQSRARTPSVTDLKMTEGEGYFGLQPHVRSAVEIAAVKTKTGEARRKSLSGQGEERRKSCTGQAADIRRKSSSGSSISSQSSGKASRGTVKQTSYG